LDFGYDDKLNGEAISQILIDGERVGVVIYGETVIWFDENLEEIGSEKLPVRAKFHFKHDEKSIAHTNQIADDESDIVIYSDQIESKHLPLENGMYPFYNQIFSPFSRWKEGVVFSKSFNDTIYYWDETGFRPLFRVDFGSSAVTRERYSQIQDAMDMLSLFREKKYNYLLGEVYGLDSDHILFQLSVNGKMRLAVMDFDTEELTVYPGLVDNSVSGLSLFSPQFVEDGVLYFGVSGEIFLENYDKLVSAFRAKLAPDYADSFFIYQLELK
jgi:hypothetical protein